MVFHAQNRAQWPMLHKLDLIGVVKIPMLSLESASIFQASHCFGLSRKVCRRFPQTDCLGPPASVSEAASASVLLRLS